MQETQELDAKNVGSLIKTALKEHWKIVAGCGAFLAILGVIAIVLPQIATISTEMLVGWLFLIGGALRLMVALRLQSTAGNWGTLAAAVLSIGLGIILIGWPLEGERTLTMLLIAFFILQGIAVILFAINLSKSLPNWSWTLLSGVVDLLLAGLIWQNWPSSATWAIGLLVGVNLLFSGLSLIMLGLAARDTPAT